MAAVAALLASCAQGGDGSAFLLPTVRGVKAAAPATWAVKVAFFAAAEDCMFAGVKEGDSTFRDFLFLYPKSALRRLGFGWAGASRTSLAGCFCSGREKKCSPGLHSGSAHI